MLRFTEYLEFFFEELETDSDGKGKLHEILVAKYLNNGEFPEHFRNEQTQRNPQETHDFLVKKHMGDEGVKHKDYIRADERARQAADKIKQELQGKGYDFNRVHKIAWTSNKKDHKELTGEEDENSDNDLMVHFKPKEGEVNETNPGKFVGLSLKVGKRKKITKRNPGIETLNRLISKPEDIDNNKKAIEKIMKEHKEGLKKIYTARQSDESHHHQYKYDLGRNGDTSLSYEPANPERAKLAKAHTDQTTAKLSDHYRGILSNLPKERMEGLIRNLSAPKTKHPSFRVVTGATSNNGQYGQEFSDHQQTLEDELSQNKHGYVVVKGRGKGFTTHIHHRDPTKPDGIGKRILSIRTKPASGSPFKGFKGEVS